MDKRKKVVLATIVIGMSMIGGCLAVRTAKTNKNKDKILSDLNTSNIALTLPSSATKINSSLVPLNKEVISGPITVKFEDYVIDGDYLILGVSERQNIKASDFKVQNKDGYKPFVDKLKKEYETDKASYSKLSDAFMQAKIDIFSGNTVDINKFNLDETEKKTLSFEIEFMQECYKWGLSSDDFKREFETSNGDKGILMESFAVPNIEVKINGDILPIEIVSTPVSLHKDHLNILGYNVENDNHLIMEFTIGIKLPKDLLNAEKLDVEVKFFDYTISPYYPVAIESLETSFSTDIKNLNFDKNILEINKEFKSPNSTIKLLNYSHTDFLSEIQIEIPKNSDYALSVKDSKGDILKPISITPVLNGKTEIATFKYDKFVDESLLITLFPDSESEQTYHLNLK